MNQNALRMIFSHPTPELPVADVERAQQHYRDTLGFEIVGCIPERRSARYREMVLRSFFAAKVSPSSLACNGYMQQTDFGCCRFLFD